MGLRQPAKRLNCGEPISSRSGTGKIQTVTGYFDKGEVPRQIGLNIIVQPFEIGPFKFGISTMVQTGNTRGAGCVLNYLS